MKIILRDITTITPYPGNPRVNDKAVEAVAASIRAFGFRQPIVVDGDGVIIAGHTRHKAAILIGMTEVPVHVATDLTPEQVRAYRIADNQTAALAEWDFDLLAGELEALKNADFDLSLLAFSEMDLARLTDMAVLPEGKEYDESAANDVKMATCPKCKHEFPL